MPIVALLVAGCALEAMPDDDPWLDGKADLPNEGVDDHRSRNVSYRAIAIWYADRGYDLDVDVSQLSPSWPLRGRETAVLNRFGTPIQFTDHAYFHTALDVLRADESASDEVLAPFDGEAAVFDWVGAPGVGASDYQTVVAVWDPRSHVIAQLVHVRPSARLRAAAGGTVAVVAGEAIGTLAAAPTSIAPSDRERLRHTHVSLIQGSGLRSLDPLDHFTYRDEAAPVVDDVYLLDEDGARTARLQTGELDVVVELHDRDDDSHRNFEVSAIAYEITNDRGEVVAASERCRLGDLIDSVEASYFQRAPQLLDFGNAAHQRARSAWPSSDIDDRERTFRYALTQLRVDEEGRCGLLWDYEGYVVVDDDVATLDVRSTLWDTNGNVTEHRVLLER